eukprot:1177478-Prorocentrum_minimum.AAC.1
MPAVQGLRVTLLVTSGFTEAIFDRIFLLDTTKCTHIFSQQTMHSINPRFCSVQVRFSPLRTHLSFMLRVFGTTRVGRRMLHLMLHHILTSNFTRDEKDTPPPHAPARGALNVLSAVCRLSPFEPPPFDSAQLRVEYIGGCGAIGPHPSVAPRRYTLTHNDLTGELLLSIGTEFNVKQGPKTFNSVYFVFVSAVLLKLPYFLQRNY